VTDIVDAATRSRMMSGIRSTNTKPEIHIRRLLHHQGFRYRLNVRDMPGKPDIVLPRFRAVLFVHGCFWHGHDCQFFRLPSTRSDFWQTKINRNRDNDLKAKKALAAAGWRVAIIWECAIRGRNAIDDKDLTDLIISWLQQGNNIPVLELAAKHKEDE